METFLLIVAVVIGLPVVLLWMSASSEAQKADAERARTRAITDAAKERLEALLIKQAEGWAFQDTTKIDRVPGLIALDQLGQSIRLATYQEVSGELQVLADEQLPVSKIKSIEISQPMKARTQVHVDQTPVAVQTQKKSPIVRGVVGGVLLGPVGAVVGGISGISGSSEIEYHETRRSETVMVRDHAVLIISTGDFKRPTIRLAFEDNRVLNQWSARLWAARGW